MKSGVWIALITAVLLTAFWDTRVILPFKLLVVLVHEMWHGISAMAAGATIDRIILHPGEAGETLVRNLKGTWGVIFSVSAGYVGTTTTGALLLRRGLVESFERLSLCIFAGLILYMTVLFTAPGSLGFNSGLGWSLTLLFAASLGDRYARNGLLIVGTV
ncbi:MAG TPA: M50 family metallopeptidase, partial [Leptospiraceae bacterium]|nr:M50 family metallopeptidase [Leptospiraceae bacterium]